MSTLDIFELVKKADYDQYTANMQKGIKILKVLKWDLLVTKTV